MPIGYSVDPNFYAEKAARAGQFIQALVQSQQQSKDRQDRLEQQQVQFFLQLAEKDPAAAAAMGPGMVEKYGKRNPGLEGYVNTLQDRGKILGNMNTATQSFTDKLTGMQNDYGRMQQHAASLPDTLPFTVHPPTLPGMAPTDSPSPWLNDQSRQANSDFAGTMSNLSPGVTLQMPNPEKARVQATLGQFNPLTFPVSAALSLPADQQALLHMNPGVAHMLPAKMPSLEDIPIEQRPLALSSMGLVSPEQVAAAKMQIGMISKPAILQAQGAASDLLDQKQSGEADNADAQRTWADSHTATEHQNALTIEAIKDTHSKQRIAQNLSGESALEDKKIGGQLKVLSTKHGYDTNDDGTIPWKAVADTNNSEMSDWFKSYQAHLNDATKQKLNPDEFASANAQWMKQNPRPVRIPDTAARYITTKVNSAIKQDPTLKDTAPIAVQGQVERYKKLMSQPGMTSDKALQMLFQPPAAPRAPLGADLAAAGAVADPNATPDAPPTPTGFEGPQE